MIARLEEGLSRRDCKVGGSWNTEGLQGWRKVEQGGIARLEQGGIMWLNKG